MICTGKEKKYVYDATKTGNPWGKDSYGKKAPLRRGILSKDEREVYKLVLQILAGISCCKDEDLISSRNSTEIYLAGLNRTKKQIDVTTVMRSQIM